MIITIIEKELLDPNHTSVGNLKYGTLVSYEENNYIKVNSKKIYGSEVIKPKAHSLLLNIKYGSIRAVPGQVIVKVMEGHLSVTPALAEKYKK